MKVFDKNGAPLESYDTDNGYLVEEQRFVKHHDAVPGRAEQGHYEVEKVYPNGGKDMKFVVDVPGIEETPAWDEYETVGIYYEYEKDPETDDDTPTFEETIAELRAQNEMLMECLLEISEIIYA